MKKIILTMVAALAVTFAFAQKKGGSDDMRFGVRGGLDMISVKIAGGGSESLTGFYLGGFAEFAIADQFVLQPGISYHSASKTVNGFDIKANFLSVPVLVKYQVAEQFNLLAGPSLYYNTDSEAQDKTTFNLDLGASYDITENFLVEARYSIGLTGDSKVNHFLVGVGYKF
ncbi:porin family protein [Flavobacterium phycosphaerae]|uniref:porin family protein n=1 Tax=Flavobacterium phycosphaerae TaxID=2697515 RepID=UPI00138A3271|nr:porin family protein [Flavobacterium phycosphaerae]